MTVRSFLTQYNLEDYADAFEAQHVGPGDLSGMSDDELINVFGMKSYGDRKRFKSAVAGLSSAPTPSLSGPTHMEPASVFPERLGNYRILGLVGSGGMGTVVRARHTEEGWAKQQGGDVAIKLIHPHIATDPAFRSRFMAEAAMGRKVQHRGFVTTWDVLSEGAWLGTVMSLVVGEPLTNKVIPGGLPVADVVRLLTPIAESLDYLHGLGIVHRDLKPANIVVRPDGQPVVLDLGIAKDSAALENHTRTMTAMGTSAWMAPEQADAKNVDGAADRYALGMIAYVLLSGRLPWEEGTSEMRVLANKLNGQLVPLAQVRPGLPEHVFAAVMKMVSVDAGARYATCGAFVGALRLEGCPGEEAAGVGGPEPSVDATLGSVVVGIDFGATKSVLAVVENGVVSVVTNQEGARSTPAIAYCGPLGERWVGAVAAQQAILHPGRTINRFQSLIGLNASQMERQARRVAYALCHGPEGTPHVDIAGERHSVTEVIGWLLAKHKLDAERHLRRPVTRAAIAVAGPVTKAKRRILFEAGRLAGLQVMRIISAGASVGLACTWGKARKDETVLTFDFGGGGTRVTILDVGDNVTEVRSTVGDAQLGGDDIDDLLIDWLICEFRAETGIDLSDNKSVLPRLREAAERAKVDLSAVQSAEIHIPFLASGTAGPHHLRRTLTRTRFNAIIEPVIDRTLQLCRRALEASVDVEGRQAQVTEVLLVGGASRIPLVRSKLEGFFGMKPNQSLNPDEVVAVGAAIQGGVLGGDVTDMLLLDVITISLGVATFDGGVAVAVPGNTTIPTSKDCCISTVADGQTIIDIWLYEGDQRRAIDNSLCEVFRFEGIPAEPRGTPRIRVAVHIDANGELNVRAVDAFTGKALRLRERCRRPRPDHVLNVQVVRDPQEDQQS